MSGPNDETDLPLTPEDVADIAAILDGSGYDRLDVTTRRFRLRMERGGEGASWTESWDWSDAAAPAGNASAADATPAAQISLPPDSMAIAAPLPGTFYHAPQPGAPPFVAIGDTVGPESVIGIVETMKLMNPVHAGVAGTITAILADNATAVEAGGALVAIRPALT